MPLTISIPELQRSSEELAIACDRLPLAIASCDRLGQRTHRRKARSMSFCSIAFIPCLIYTEKRILKTVLTWTFIPANSRQIPLPVEDIWSKNVPEQEAVRSVASDRKCFPNKLIKEFSPSVFSGSISSRFLWNILGAPADPTEFFFFFLESGFKT